MCGEHTPFLRRDEQGALVEEIHLFSVLKENASVPERRGVSENHPHAHVLT